MVFVRGWPHIEVTQNFNFAWINLKTNNKHFLKHKYDYLELCLKISKLRYSNKEVPIDLLLLAQKLGSLAQIPDAELNALLFNLQTE